MTLTAEQFQTVMTGGEETRVESLRKLLGYPVIQRDPKNPQFWFLRPGKDELDAAETCPIAVRFYSELNQATERQIKLFLTTKDQQPEIYGHYSSRVNEDQPVMYLLLPNEECTGKVALVLPTEGKLRQRNVQAFDWNCPELLRSRLPRLYQKELPIAAKALHSIPLVERVFYPTAKTAEELARALAEVTRRMEQLIPRVYKAEKVDGYLHKLLKSFQRELLPELKLASTDEKDYSFADIYAQTIAYGLFTARVFGYVKYEEAKKKQGEQREPDFNRESAWQQLPETNPFLRQLFRDISERELTDLGDELIEAIVEIFCILRAAKMDTILLDFRQKMYQEDIVIRFYEDFLAAYKPQMRERRGVYYTPEPIVSYIVRSVDHILRTDFGLPDGLADASKIQVNTPDGKGKTETHRVLITDPAVGTGTFLHGVIDHIHKSFEFKPNEWSDYVSQHLLPRLLGFELLMAPYAVAHMKLGLQLANFGYQFDTEERLRVYLTNTLQEAFQIPPTDGYSNWIRDEADAANKIKQEAPVMVVLGNPPYSGHSANTGIWITNLLKGKDTLTNQPTSNYFEVDGKPLGERNPKWLNDDYVKFIRFSQWRIEQTGYGILAFVTNHGYLDNPTFRGMRQSLMKTFDDIYVLDLHGNSKKKEQCPDGSKDENVFDIQQGVTVSIFVKCLNGKKDSATVHHAHRWGLREVYEETSNERCLVDGKYHWLEKNDVSTTPWRTLNPQSPFYLFVPQDINLLAEYEQGWKVTDIFPVNSVGIVTARDSLTIHWSKEEAWDTITDFVELPLETARAKYSLGKDARDWKVELAQKDLKIHPTIETKEIGPFKELLAPLLYRPFDVRHTYYTGKSRGFHCMPRSEVMHHMLAGDNLGLIASRQTRDEWHILATNKIMGHKSLAAYDINYLFPLYINSKTLVEKNIGLPCRPNISPEFIDNFAAQLSLKFSPNGKGNLQQTFGTEDIFFYIYAVFHSPTYRLRYTEFLKSDFPRIPLTSNKKLFHQLIIYGEELVALHLMTSPKLDNLLTKFVESSSNRTVASGYPKYEQGNVVLNKKGDRFTDVPEEVWNFYVGGYQVCHKWLKDRKNRILSEEDIQHYQRIVVALKETIELMKKIDEAIPEWPIQ
jgi:hypothetical protein